MLIVAGTLNIDPEHRPAMLEAVRPMVTATRAEAGCREYVFSADPDDPSVVRLFELWDDEEALSAHLDSAHMAQWQSRAASLPIQSRDIAKYTISEIGPLR